MNMPVRKLSSGKIVQVNSYEGKKRVVIYGIGDPIKKGSPDEEEAYQIGRLIADDVEVITDQKEIDNDDVCDMFEGDYDFWDMS